MSARTGESGLGDYTLKPKIDAAESNKVRSRLKINAAAKMPLYRGELGYSLCLPNPIGRDSALRTRTV